MARKPKIPGLPVDVMQAWALFNETLRSVPFLGITLAVVFLEVLEKYKIISPAMATLLEGLLAAGAIAQWLAPVAGGSTAAAGIITTGAVGAAGSAASAIAGLPLLPVAVAGAGAAGVGYASHRTGQEAAKQLAALDVDLRAGKITKRQAADQIREIMVSQLPS